MENNIPTCKNNVLTHGIHNSRPTFGLCVEREVNVLPGH